MKKIMTVFLIFILIVSLCACDNNNVSPTVNNNANNETNITEDTNNTQPSNSGDVTNQTDGTVPTDDNEDTSPTNPTDPTENNTPMGGDPTDRDEKDETNATESTKPTDAPGWDPTETTTKPTEPHKHNYTTTVTKPTCTKEGYTTYVCACGDTYFDNKTNVLAHEYGEWKTTVAPTESRDGRAERKCKHCGHIDEKNLPKIVNNHTCKYTETVTTKPTCTRKGVKTYQCSCGAQYMEDIPMIEHSYNAVVTKPTCDKGGYTTYTCSCGDTYVGAKTNPLGHSYKHEVINPTCTTTGYTMHTCTRCGVYYADAKTNALSHNYKLTSETKATCTKNGSKVYTCTRCSATKTETTTLLGHNYYVSSDTKATCTSDGKKMEICKNCGDSKTVATYPATGHQHTKVETAEPTCSTKGYTRTVCTDCGAVISSVETNATGCDYSLVMSGPDAAQPMIDKYNAMNRTDEIVHLRRQYLYLSGCTDWDVNVCSICGEADFSSLTYKYTAMEAAEIMAGYINQLRYELYGTHDYDVKVCEPLMEISSIRAEEILTNYTHTTTTKKYGAMENIHRAGPTASIYNFYLGWFNSPAHYAAMVDKNNEYFAFSTAWSAPVDLNDLDTLVNSTKSQQGAVQLFWDYMELYEYCVLKGYSNEKIAELLK